VEEQPDAPTAVAVSGRVATPSAAERSGTTRPPKTRPYQWWTAAWFLASQAHRTTGNYCHHDGYPARRPNQQSTKLPMRNDWDTPSQESRGGSRTRIALAWTLWLVNVGCCVAFLAVIRLLTPAVVADAVFLLVFLLSYATIGLVVTRCRPANPIGCRGHAHDGR
jgi:hypothetical protein